MSNLRSVDDVIARLKMTPRCPELSAPSYTGPADDPRQKVALGVSSMAQHTTDEGNQLTEGLKHAGYVLYGRGYPNNVVELRAILNRANPSVVFMQDIREWGEHCGARDFRDPAARFFHIEELGQRPDIFKVALSKDSHNSVELCNHSFQQIQAMAFVHTYHPSIVKHVNPGVRPQHLIRSWHSVEPKDVPPFDVFKREGCLLSGALSPVYPLRQRLYQNLSKLPQTTMLGHPGYQRRKCMTPEFLSILSRFKVAICTSSVFGYALRKLSEATAAGCHIVTDLPTDEQPPIIEENLVRVSPDISINEMRDLLTELMGKYDPEKQRDLAERCKAFYCWRATGLRLAADIERMRLACLKEQK